MTNALTGLTTICYAAQLFAQQRGWSLTDCGALKPSLIVRRGEWWRLITPMLLHSPPDEGFCGLPVHLVLNMWSLQNIGSVLEQIYGPWRMLNAYVLSGVGGSAFYSIVAGDESEAVGASAGICGLVGALGATLYRHPNPAAFESYVQSQRNNLGSNAAITIASNVSLMGHLGGFLTGAGFGLVAGPRPIVRYDRLGWHYLEWK